MSTHLIVLSDEVDPLASEDLHLVCRTLLITLALDVKS